MKISLMELNESWKTYLDDNRLLLLAGLEQHVATFLYELEFSKPTYTVYNQHMQSEHSVWGVIVKHPSTDCVRAGSILMSISEYQSLKHAVTNEWVLYPSLTFSEFGQPISRYFFETTEKRTDNAILNDLFNNFGLTEKIKDCPQCNE